MVSRNPLKGGRGGSSVKRQVVTLLVLCGVVHLYGWERTHLKNPVYRYIQETALLRRKSVSNY